MLRQALACSSIPLIAKVLNGKVIACSFCGIPTPSKIWVNCFNNFYEIFETGLPDRLFFQV
jgi:hypothetical protein